ncbi:MAG: transcription-repair coupling factor [Gammaproteobacteria bacterium]|nr:transcription-repair coupling factor [Gammaproteobacteria bacterium]
MDTQTLQAGQAYSPAAPPHPSRHEHWCDLHAGARSLALAESARGGRLLVIVTPDVRGRERLEDELRFYLGANGPPVLTFPDWECLPYDAFSPHPDIVSGRLSTLAALPHLTRGVVLLAASTLMHRLPPGSHLLGHSFLLHAGDRLDIESFRERLVRGAYRAVGQVAEPGEFAVRGGIIDVYPMGAQTAFRLDLFDDVIESIRTFDPDTQRSETIVSEMRVLPAREHPLTDEAVQAFRAAYRATFAGDPRASLIYRDVSAGLSPPGIEYYLPLFFEEMATFFDYLPAQTTLVFLDDARDKTAAFIAEAAERYEACRANIERPALPPARLFLDTDALTQALAPFGQIHAGTAGKGVVRHFLSSAPPTLPLDARGLAHGQALIEYLRHHTGRVLLVAETAGRREALRSLLGQHGLVPRAFDDWASFMAAHEPLGLLSAPLDQGLEMTDPHISVIVESQLYGERAQQRRRRVKVRDQHAVLKGLSELKTGDAVVHEDHGVGRYLGLVRLRVTEQESEFLALEYADGDKLYLPVTDLHLITRYTGTNPDQAPLHKLGGDSWDKAKKRAQEKARDAAAELLEIYARRAARPGHAFAARDAAYERFASAFPFEETPDQTRVIQEVLADMEIGRPMDRLVCGDVGFGKTEVAMRAAFLAIHDHRQVAVLVPTTLLAQQHYQNFRDRFADLPVEIALLSRFRTKTEIEQTLQRLAAGQVDIIIGTHRLLQDDVRFKNLGLVIIDEEHRFGVRQKERMKALRAHVDILTLTATPLPRTLNMAMAGLRDVSLIGTPPQDRLSIKTFVTSWQGALIREACLREIRRGGQIYFLHNDVRTMERREQSLRELIPEADIRIAHGQMPERELERVMLDFYHQRFQILLCSTIIETGIDVPTANTIIIERADRFGLAQLHQLRGRVGRSHHRAYAYLLTPEGATLAGDARKRLEAITSLEDLGAGFALASHDLEIRGAGELLGESQSGQIDEVGFTLYGELLERAVATLKAGGTIEDTSTFARVTDMDLHVPALLPDDYCDDPHTRLVFYKRIANAAGHAELDDLAAELSDRFGPPPKPAARLFDIARLRHQARALGVARIDAGPKGARIEFTARPNVDPGTLIRLIQSDPRQFRLDGPQGLRVSGEWADADVRIRALGELLGRLTDPAQAGTRSH